MLEVKAITKSYGKGRLSHPVLADISFTASAGEFIAVTGESGSGKSTLLSVIGLLQQPTSGDVVIDGQSCGRLTMKDRARVRRAYIGFVFQNFALLPQLTIGDNVALPLVYDGYARDVCRSRVQTMLDIFGVQDLADRYPSETSGGEQQRVALARAFARFPPVILADEPTGNLDAANADFVIGSLKNAAEATGSLVIVVTHDSNLAGHAHRTIHLKRPDRS